MTSILVLHPRRIDRWIAQGFGSVVFRARTKEYSSQFELVRGRRGAEDRASTLIIVLCEMR